MYFIAHRGFRISVLENTFEAFAMSYTLGMDFIECDIQLSRDGIPFILHDASLLRTFGHNVEIAELTAKEINELPVQSPEKKLPQLEELLQYQIKKGFPTKLMLELKGPGSGAVAGQMVKEMEAGSQVVFSGREMYELLQVHRICPDVPLCLNITKCKTFPLVELFEIQTKHDLPLPFQMISLKSSHEQIFSFIRHCHAIGCEALAWNFLTYNDPLQKMQKLISEKIDGILFDDPRTVGPIRELIE